MKILQAQVPLSSFLLLLEVLSSSVLVIVNLFRCGYLQVHEEEKRIPLGRRGLREDLIASNIP